jgi:hypothetical protein
LTAGQIAELVWESKSAITPLTKKVAVDTSTLVVGHNVYVLNSIHHKGQVVAVAPDGVEVDVDLMGGAIRLRFDRDGKWLDGGEECGPWHLWVGREWGWFMKEEYWEPDDQPK